MRLDRFRRLQDSQNLFELAHMLGIYASSRVILEKLPQSLMLEALDHFYPIAMLGDVQYSFTHVQPCFT